jgi:penicillin-binding protein 2
LDFGIYFISAFKKTQRFYRGDELNADKSSSFRGNPALERGEDVINKFVLVKINKFVLVKINKFVLVKINKFVLVKMESYSSAKKESWLSWFLKGVFFVGFLILITRLFELQIVKGSYFRNLSEGNRIRRVPIVAPRGKILARGGEVLVGNKEVERKVIFDPVEGFKKLDDLSKSNEGESILEWVRSYELGKKFAHVSGYLGEVNESEVGKVNPMCQEKGPRALGSVTGRTGLEEAYECSLLGIDGEELVEVDSLGIKVRTLGKKDPIPGDDIKTTIDFGLQKKVSEIFDGIKGAVIVTDSNGEVLALYSSPSYDPNIFVNSESDDNVIQVLEDENLPFFNRVIGGAFHPGSVFKPVVAVAALEESAIDDNYTYDDPGVITISTPYGIFSYSNWYYSQYGGKEGEIDLIRAITRSTDTFFYNLGELLGIDKLDKWAYKFGLGETTGIDLPGEISGLVPSPDWKEKYRGERWFLGNTYHMSIGQGDIALTPLEINQAISSIATGGIYCKPYIVLDVEELGIDKFQMTNSECKDLGIDKKTIDLVKEGMKGACSYGGTGFTFFDFTEKSGKTVACKTGTAETEEEEKTHAWFTVFAPVDDPEIITTVLVEKGGEGAYVAGPIAREIFDYWFGREN